jgi:hypothetical protein
LKSAIESLQIFSVPEINIVATGKERKENGIFKIVDKKEIEK